MSVVKKLFSLDENVARELEIVAATLQTTQKEIVESALNFYFDYTDGLVADKITQDIHDGKMETYDKSDVYQKLGIDL